MARKARFNLPGIAKGLFSLRGVDALKPDAMLGVGAVEDGDAVAIGDFDDFPGEGVGRGRYGEKYEEANDDYTGYSMHFPIPGIPGFKSLTGDIVVR